MTKSPHPSGKPKRPERKGIASQWNIPREDYVTPRLQRGQNAHAIGFTVNRLPGTDEDDE